MAGHPAPNCHANTCRQGRCACPCPQACCLVDGTEANSRMRPSRRTLVRAIVGMVLVCLAVGVFGITIVWAAGA